MEVIIYLLMGAGYVVMAGMHAVHKVEQAPTAIANQSSVTENSQDGSVL